ncbi:MAG: hypothetical protein IJF80_00835 [Clostridia bacterium]|nr:hypothetical protein [Clostridia bacterium]
MEWIKKQLTKPRTFIILFVVSLIIPHIINISYLCGQDIKDPYITMWNAEAVLSFYGSYLSFFGSIILGAVAVFQTEKANKQTDDSNKIAINALKQAERSNQLAQQSLQQSEQANELAANMQKLEQAKFMSVVSIKKVYINKREIRFQNYHTPEINNPIIFDMVDKSYWSFSKCYHVDVVFVNLSNYPIVELQVNAKGVNSDANIKHGIKSAKSEIYMPPKEEKAFRFIIPSYFFEKYSNDGIEIVIEFLNVFGFSTLGNIKIDNLELNYKNKDNYKFQIKKW